MDLEHGLFAASLQKVISLFSVYDLIVIVYMLLYVAVLSVRFSTYE